MQKYSRGVSTVFMLIVGLVIGLTWNRVGAAQKSGANQGGTVDAQEMGRLKKAADIAEIMNLQAQYTHAIDSGRLDEVADLNTDTGGRGYYYQDPVTTHLHATGTPVDVKGEPIKGFPGCIMFGRENVISYLAGAGTAMSDSIRPHVDGWKGMVGRYPGKPGYVSRHVITNLWVEVNGDTAKLHDFYQGQTLSESDLVRTPKGWKFQYRKVIANKASPDRPCVIADSKFPIPAAGSLGGVPNFIDPL